MRPAVGPRVLPDHMEPAIYVSSFIEVRRHYIRIEAVTGQLLDVLEHLVESTRDVFIILIPEDHPVAGAGVIACLPGVSRTAVIRRPRPDDVQLLLILPDNIIVRFGRAVVRDHDLHVLEVLGDQAVQHPANERPGIIAGQDHAKLWHNSAALPAHLLALMRPRRRKE